MSAIDKYYQKITKILADIFDEEEQKIEAAARIVAKANKEKRSVFAFGCNHAGLVTLELFYRTGGLITINPVRIPGMMLDVTPITMSSQLERIEGYGKVMFDSLPAKANDVIIIHSVSGRTASVVELAYDSLQKGINVVVLTSLEYAGAVEPVHPSGKRLHELVTAYLDNCAPAAEAMLDVPGLDAKFAAASGLASVFIMWSVTAVAIETMLNDGYTPGVFKSVKFPGGWEHLEKVKSHYEEFGW